MESIQLKDLKHKVEVLEKCKFELQKFILDLSILINEFVHSSNFKDISNNKHQPSPDDL